MTNLANIRDYHLGIYPSKAAALNMLRFMPDQHLEPVKITWWPIGVNARNHSYVLNKPGVAYADLERELRIAWPYNICVGKHLDPLPA